MRVWLYGRLSNDDDVRMNSLENQLEIVRAFASEKGHRIVGESFDDNVSGMRFDRKGLNQVTQAVDAGKIDAVIVKDLSRLGRHQMQTALFIDYLRQCGVAVISVTEGLNTMDDGHDLIIGVRQLMNDFYAKDIGNKIRHGYREKQKEGIVIKAPFGYWKDRNTGRIRLHPEASVTVQIIYGLYSEGLGQKEITRRLNAMQRKTPKQLHDERCGKAEGKVYRWTYQSVKNVLVEKSYTGLLVNHQTETHGRTVTPVPEDEQYLHEDFYPVIIDREEWEQVQAMPSLTVATPHPTAMQDCSPVVTAAAPSCRGFGAGTAAAGWNIFARTICTTAKSFAHPIESGKPSWMPGHSSTPRSSGVNGWRNRQTCGGSIGCGR